jgi:hypothetical protein
VVFIETGVNMGNQRVHTLQKPLRIASKFSKHYYLLPAGTVLYFDTSLSEGMDRFFVYINVEGEELELKEVEREGLIAPLTAYPIEKKDIVELLNAYPLSTDDLAKILNSQPISESDLQEIVNQFKNRAK